MERLVQEPEVVLSLESMPQHSPQLPVWALSSSFCANGMLGSNHEQNLKAKAGNIWVEKSICLSSNSYPVDVQF